MRLFDDRDKTSVMTEEPMAGGTRVNRGCLRSKNLIEAAKVIHDARHPRYAGLTPAELGLDFRKLSKTILFSRA